MSAVLMSRQLYDDEEKPGQQCGHLALKIVTIAPWETLTIMDTATNLLEIIRIDNKTSENITQQFANTWLSRYPWPVQVIHDNGGKFIGHEFQDMLRQFGITAKPTTVKNPQSNAIVEQLHKTMTDILRVMMR